MENHPPGILFRPQTDRGCPQRGEPWLDCPAQGWGGGAGGGPGPGLPSRILRKDGEPPGKLPRPHDCSRTSPGDPRDGLPPAAGSVEGRSHAGRCRLPPHWALPGRVSTGENVEQPRWAWAPLGGDPLTSQVMTSSDLLPPPPLTLAGVTSGTVQGTRRGSCQGQRQMRAPEAAGLVEVTQFRPTAGCTHTRPLRSETPKHPPPRGSDVTRGQRSWPRFPSNKAQESWAR